MEIKRQYLQKYLHQIASEQLVSEYREKGYVVSTEERIGNFEADIIARKNNETIIIEVKTGRLTPQTKERIAGIANYVKQKGDYKFLIVVATPPKEKKLKIVDIEQILSDYFLNAPPEELDELSTHTRLEEVASVDINEITIDGQYILVKGNAVFEIELQFGSASDQNNDIGYKSSDSILFKFDITFEYSDNKNLKIYEINNLKVDTSSYYGEP